MLNRKDEIGYTIEETLQQFERMTYQIYHRYFQGSLLEMDDFISEGNLGILRAYETYDAKKGALSTHVYNFIYGYMRNYQRNNRSVVSGCKGMTKKELEEKQLLVLPEQILSFNQEGLEIHPSTSGGYHTCERLPFEDYLSDSDLDIVTKYFGFDCEQMTMKEIASLYGCTRSAIGKRLQRIIEKLRKVEGIEDYYENIA
jgi:RNA polymerase sigma factor (sigma-70 family)